MTYRKWIDGIAKGRTVVSMDGHREFLDLRLGRVPVGRGEGERGYGPGDEARVKGNEKIIVKVTWTSMEPMNGWIELVNNGKVIARQDGPCRPGAPVIITIDPSFAGSGWLCARRMDSTGHKLHTAPVYITVDGGKMKASKEDAGFFLEWIDNILEKIKPGGPWNKYFPTTLEQVQAHYHAARDIYKKLSEQP